MEPPETDASAAIPIVSSRVKVALFSGDAEDAIGFGVEGDK